MKTVEATIAIVLFLVFLAFLTLGQYKAQPEIIPQDIILIQDTVFNEIETNQIHRTSALDLNETELNNFLDLTVPERYNQTLTVCETTTCNPLTFNTEEKVYVDTLVISNITKTVYLTLYIWQE